MKYTCGRPHSSAFTCCFGVQPVYPSSACGPLTHDGRTVSYHQSVRSFDRRRIVVFGVTVFSEVFFIDRETFSARLNCVLASVHGRNAAQQRPLPALESHVIAPARLRYTIHSRTHRVRICRRATETITRRYHYQR